MKYKDLKQNVIGGSIRLKADGNIVEIYTKGKRVVVKQFKDYESALKSYHEVVNELTLSVSDLLMDIKIK